MRQGGQRRPPTLLPFQHLHYTPAARRKQSKAADLTQFLHVAGFGGFVAHRTESVHRAAHAHQRQRRALGQVGRAGKAHQEAGQHAGQRQAGAEQERRAALAALAALLFCTAQTKVAYVPGGRSGGWVFFTGSAAFLLCTCLAFPGTLARFMVGLAGAADLAEAAALALVGVCGAVYAFGSVGEPAPEENAASQM